MGRRSGGVLGAEVGAGGRGYAYLKGLGRMGVGLGSMCARVMLKNVFEKSANCRSRTGRCVGT